MEMEMKMKLPCATFPLLAPKNQKKKKNNERYGGQINETKRSEMKRSHRFRA